MLDPVCDERAQRLISSLVKVVPVARAMDEFRFSGLAQDFAGVKNEACRPTVYRLISAGDIPAVRIGKSYRIREDDLDRYLSTGYTQAV